MRLTAHCLVYDVQSRYILVRVFSRCFFDDPPTDEIYTLSLHDALPILADSANRVIRPSAAWRNMYRTVDLRRRRDRKSTRLNSSHANISYAVFCLKKKKKARMD